MTRRYMKKPRLTPGLLRAIPRDHLFLNPGGPGNPYARRVAAMRTQLLDAVDSDGIAEVARALLAAAKAGDTAAARLVLSYAVGPPLPAADPDRLDSNELEALRSRPNMFDRFALSNLTPEPMSLFRDEVG